jgi:hypothetical protein
MFQIGTCYSRQEIHEKIGGGIQDYLPHVNGKVVCGCFRKDTNPGAPDVVLPGRGRDIMRWAAVFREQKYPIPIFIKQRTNEWLYVGNFLVDHWSDDKQVIAVHEPIQRNGSVSSVLFLKSK